MKIIGYPGDPLGVIRGIWLWKKAWLTHQPLEVFFDWLEYPFGQQNFHLKEFAIEFPVNFLALFTNEVFAYNFFVLLSFPLAFLTIFILTKYLTKNNLAAFVAGLIYTFSPYHYWHAYSHSALAQIQWLPLFLLALLKFDAKPSRGRAFWLVLSFLLVFFTSFYYGYFMLIVAVVFFALRIVYDFFNERKKYLTRTRLFGFAWALVFGIIFFAYPAYLAYQDYNNSKLFSVEKTVYQRDFEQLLYLSARPWDYLLPSIDNPFFGRFSQEFRQRLHIWESNLPRRNFFWIDVGNLEGTLFLGFTPLILAFYAICNRKRTKLQKEIFIFGFLALAAFFFSLPPFIEIGKFKLVLPSMFLSWLTLVFRTIVRWGVVVLLFTTILAAVGLDILLKKIKLNWQKRLVTFLAFALIAIEFINIPPFHFTDVSQTPAEYEWLAKQPGDFVIAEYELDDNMALFFQRVHGKKLLARYYRERLPLYDLDSKGKLRQLGVSYILFHRKSPFPEFNPTNEYVPVEQVLDSPPAMKDYKMVFETEDTQIFEL